MSFLVQITVMRNYVNLNRSFITEILGSPAQSGEKPGQRSCIVTAIWHHR
jgi:hypothetical protein